MKIQDRPPSPVTPDATETGKPDQAAKPPKPFAGLLRKDPAEEARQKAGELPAELAGEPGGELSESGEMAERTAVLARSDADPSPSAPFTPVAAVAQQTQMPAEVEAPRSVAEPRLIQGIVSEIVMAAEPGGTQEVQIQLNSRTLDGLKINISKDAAGEIAVKFITANENVAQMLQRNVQTLSHSLAAKCLPVAGIQVQTSSSGSGSGSSGGGSQKQSGRGRGGGR